MIDVEQYFYLLNQYIPVNEKLYEQIKTIVNESLVSQEYGKIKSIIPLEDNEGFEITSEINLINDVVIIIEKEISNRGASFFCQNIYDFEKLIAYYKKITMMLRRLEFRFDDVFVSEALTFFKENKVSPEAVTTILDRGYFEHKKEVSSILFFSLEKMLDFEEKKLWLEVLFNEYKDGWMKEELNRLKENDHE